MSHFSPICPPFLHHFPPFFFLVGTVSYIFHHVFVTTSHFPPFFSISPHFPPFSPIFPPFSPIFPHFPSFSLIFPIFPIFPVACWILGYSRYGYFLGLQELVNRGSLSALACFHPLRCYYCVFAYCLCQVSAIIGRGEDHVGVEIPFTLRAKTVLDESQREVCGRCLNGRSTRKTFAVVAVTRPLLQENPPPPGGVGG